MESFPRNYPRTGRSINNNVISGIGEDLAGVYHGFQAFPNVVLPVTSSGGAFVFDVAVAPNTPVFLDSDPAVGYRLRPARAIRPSPA